MTAMQELIDKLEKSVESEKHVMDNPKGYHYNDILQANSIYKAVISCVGLAKSLLPLERQQHSDTWTAGNSYGFCEGADISGLTNHPDRTQYLNTLYETE